MYMSDTIGHAQTDSQRLRANYRDAFSEWALRVNQLHGVSTGADDPVTIDAAQHRVEAAEIVYRESRDRLTEEMNHH